MSTRPLSTLDAWRAWAEQVPAAAEVWRRRLAKVKADAVAAILTDIHPDRMSAICRQFTLDLLTENRKRILESEVP